MCIKNYEKSVSYIFSLTPYRRLEFDLHVTWSTPSALIGGAPIFLGTGPLLPPPIRSTGTIVHRDQTT
jgi:hypothetical protein